MTGTMELEDQDVQDLIECINHFPDRRKGRTSFLKRLDKLKERLLQVEVNAF